MPTKRKADVNDEEEAHLFPPSTDEDTESESFSENENDDYVPNEDDDDSEAAAQSDVDAEPNEDDEEKEETSSDEEDAPVASSDDEQEDEVKGGSKKRATTERKTKKRQKEQADEEMRQDMFERLKHLELDAMILEQHPEVLSETMEEVKARCVIKYNAHGMIEDDQHKTTPILTKYELTRVLGQRTKQLNAGAPCLLDERPNILDNFQIAQQELQAKRLPFILRRPLPGGKFEYWRLQDLQLVL